MSLRITSLIWMASFAIAAFGLYLVKYTVEDVKRQVAALKVEESKEREALHLLNAEWAYLNRPERLRALSEKHLALSPLESRRIQDVNVLPAAFEDAAPTPTPVRDAAYRAENE